MASNKIEYLPIEIIGIILEDKSISIMDIMRFKSTCKRLQQTTLSNYFWKKKFYQRCPTARKYCTQKPKKTFDYINFEELIKTGIKHVKKIQYYVSLMSDNNLSTTDKKELESFLLYIPTINSPLLERLITIVAQYLQPHVSYSVIKMWLDNISQEILDRVKMKHPTHPIFSTSVEQFLFWKNNNINDHFWNSTETMQIILRNIVCSMRSAVMHSACFYDDVWIKDYYKHITNVIQVRSDKTPKERKEGMKFAVGMIVTFSSPDLLWLYDSRTFDGVIIGWHDKYKIFALIDSKDVFPFLNDHANSNFVDKVCCSTYRQPHYIILAENNKICYAPQDKISKCPPKEINNIEIGRFFYRFEGTHYVPNKNLQQRYPYDMQYYTECITNFGE
ncbi:uncharacterized protein LOC112639704 [Camponotus floridanus]|uniref:uncharacterized protein LOC112639704 n=1 Tax=Camponotus floridanus TaxID=104421 RepID=UPI000DC676DB|nr:uncharacterized protein LOC112639704 [Camponotus floridanus]